MKLKFFLFFVSLNASSQVDKIQKIIFEYRLNLKSIKISIYPSFSNRNGMILKSQIKDSIKEIQISKEDFKQIQDAVINIDVKDLYGNFKMGLDGSTTKILFGDRWNEVSYSVWGLNKSDEKTPFKDFLHVTELILKLANIKISELN